MIRRVLDLQTATIGLAFTERVPSMRIVDTVSYGIVIFAFRIAYRF